MSTLLIYGIMMQRHLKDEIKKVYDNYNLFVVTINGDCGSGKTFFWNKFKDKLPSNTKYAYISLFGKESIEDIKHPLFKIVLKSS